MSWAGRLPSRPMQVLYAHTSHAAFSGAAVAATWESVACLCVKHVLVGVRGSGTPFQKPNTERCRLCVTTQWVSPTRRGLLGKCAVS